MQNKYTEKKREYDKEYYKKNIEGIKIKNSEQYKKNREDILKKRKLYYENNKEYLNQRYKTK